MKKKLISVIFGLFIGLINGLLGAGGGMLAVPALRYAGLSQKEAHENAVILPLTLLSAVLYVLNGRVAVSDALIYLPGGLVGSLIGTRLMKKISNIWLTRIFGGFMIFAGVRMLF